jgi:anti-sigma B factor antagonist
MKAHGLTISSTQRGAVTVVALGGYLDGHTTSELDRALKGHLQAGHRRLVLDLSRLDYIASAGVGMFISTHHQLRGNGSFQLAGPTANVSEIFTILGLASVLGVHATLDDAIRAAGA